MPLPEFKSLSPCEKMLYLTAKMGVLYPVCSADYNSRSEMRKRKGTKDPSFYGMVWDVSYNKFYNMVKKFQQVYHLINKAFDFEVDASPLCRITFAALADANDLMNSKHILLLKTSTSSYAIPDILVKYAKMTHPNEKDLTASFYKILTERFIFLKVASLYFETVPISSLSQVSCQRLDAF
jgi:hypothetical protein